MNRLIRWFLTLGLGFAPSGCLSSAPVVPVTPQNQAQVSSCENTATLHNGFVVGGMVLGGSTSGLSGVAAALSSDQTQAKTDLAIAAAVAGGLTLIATGGAGLTSANFTNSKCTDVVGPLPAAPDPKP